MADWDADGPRLRTNLNQLLGDIARWAAQRDQPSAATLKRWHRQAMAGLQVPGPGHVGRFRGQPGLEHEPVHVGQREGTPAALVGGDVAAFIQRLQSVAAQLDRLLPRGAEPDRDGLQAVVELAAWAHSEWVRIHPFANGNGRIARLLANALLMRYGLPPVLALRPRPKSPYGQAGAAGMDGNPAPMAALLLRLLKEVPALG